MIFFGTICAASTYYFAEHTPLWEITAKQAQEKIEATRIQRNQTATRQAVQDQAMAEINTAFQTIQATATWLAEDSDGDGLTNEDELEHHTLPDNRDTDSDGIPDGLEVNKFHTNPLMPDTDLDSVSDSEELKNLINPLNPDTDYDKTPDYIDTEINSLAGIPTPGVNINTHQAQLLVLDDD